ncbi:hypothetical protein [Bordetella avium]
MPLDLREWLERKAAANDRSLHKEILRQLNSERAKENALTVAAVKALVQ